MTQDEIIRMMKEAGFYIGKDDEFEPAWERFAALVAAHEREACAKVCEELITDGVFPVTKNGEVWHYNCAAAIRARSNQ